MNSSTLSWVISSCRIVLVKVGREQLAAKGVHKKNFPSCDLNLRLQNEPRERWFVHTVDGGNPAPVDMMNIPVFTGFHTMSTGAGFQPSTVVMVSYRNDLQQLITYTYQRMFTASRESSMTILSFTCSLSSCPFLLSKWGPHRVVTSSPWVIGLLRLATWKRRAVGDTKGETPCICGGPLMWKFDWQR